MDSEYEPVARYANSLRADYAAVRNSLLYPNISNGPLEGHNSRIKFKHRRSGGRAGLDLLNAYFVLSDYTFEQLFFFYYHRVPV
jgi:transposase